jgi:hypothetical protein
MCTVTGDEFEDVCVSTLIEYQPTDKAYLFYFCNYVAPSTDSVNNDPWESTEA